MGVCNYTTCDKCGRIINDTKHKEDYYVTTIRIISKGKQYRQPTCYLCLDCFKKSGLPLFPSNEGDKK